MTSMIKKALFCFLSVCAISASAQLPAAFSNGTGAVMYKKGSLAITTPAGFLASNDIARSSTVEAYYSALSSSNAVQDAAIALRATQAALAATSAADRAYADSLTDTTALTNGVGSGCTVTTTGKTFYVSVVAPTGTAASVDADLQDHKTNATAHAGMGWVDSSTATSIVQGIAYPLTGNPSGFLTNAPADNLTWTSKVDAATLGGYVATGAVGTASASNANAFATAAQGALAQATATNTLDLAGTRAMTGASVTLARDVKSRDATSVGIDGAAFGEGTTAGVCGAAFGLDATAGNFGAAFGYRTTAGISGAAFGGNTIAGDSGAAFGEGTTAGVCGAAFGYLTTAGIYGAAFGRQGKGGVGSFVFSDYTVAYFDRTAYTNWFSVRASGGTYFETPNLTVTGTVTATSFNGSGSSLTSLDLNPSLTATVAKAAAALTNITASMIAQAGGVTNVYNDPVLTSSNLLGFAGTTCTITRAMGNALNLTPTGTVYFAADATLTDTNVVAGFTLDLFYNAQTFGFVGASMTNTATLTSNAWNSIIFWKGRGSSVFVGK